MKRLIQWSIEHHWMVLVFSVLLLGAGVWTAREMPVDVFPDLTAPTVTILTEGHGMAPDETDTVVRRRLLAVSGVSQVTPIGGAERQFQVIAHPDQLRANSISLTELLASVRGASQNTSAGIYTEGPQEYVLQAIGRVRTPEEIGETVVAMRGGRSVLVRDIADVRGGAAFKRGEGSRDGKPAVIVGVQKQPGAT